MVYPIVCIMPRNRAFSFQDGALVVISDGPSYQNECCSSSSSSILCTGNNSLTASPIDSNSEVVDGEDGYDDRLRGDDNMIIKVYDQDCSLHSMRYEEVGRFFGFTYISRLVFLHESDLRNYGAWGLDCDSQDIDDNANRVSCNSDNVSIDRLEAQGNTSAEATSEIVNQMVKGHVHPHLFVRYIPDCGDIKIGYGLFTSQPILRGTSIGEYVGILLTSMPEPSSYSLNYPCSDGNHEINATEYGNLTRFINHSVAANCSFKHVFFEGIAHVICISLRAIGQGEQITVNYGSSYWHARGIDPASF